MNTITNTQDAAPPTPVPTILITAFNKVDAVLGKTDDKVRKALAEGLHSLIPLAIPFAAAWDKFGTDAGCVATRSGNIVDSRVYDKMVEAGLTGHSLKSQPVRSRVLTIGRTVPAGEEEATYHLFADAAWTQPAEAVAPDATPETFTNPVRIETFATWLEARTRGEQHPSHVIVDGVLMTRLQHAERVATYVAPVDDSTTFEPVPVTTEEASEHLASLVEAGEPEGDTVTNEVNLGALLAVFARCDNATVINYVADYDLSEYDAEEMQGLALAIVGAMTLARREALAVTS